MATYLTKLGADKFGLNEGDEVFRFGDTDTFYAWNRMAFTLTKHLEKWDFREIEEGANFLEFLEWAGGKEVTDLTVNGKSLAEGYNTYYALGYYILANEESDNYSAYSMSSNNITDNFPFLTNGNLHQLFQIIGYY